jgi:hypothetical protein
VNLSLNRLMLRLRLGTKLKELIDSVEARGGVWSGEDEAKYAEL